MKRLYIILSIFILVVSFPWMLAQDGFRVYPYLQNPSSDAMTIIWFSEFESPGILIWKVENSGEETQISSMPSPASTLAYSDWENQTFFNNEAPAPPYKHRIRLEGLESATQYTYTVEQGPETFSSVFKTSPVTTDSLRFIVYADSETEPESTNKFTSWVDPASNQWRPYLVDQTTGYSNNLDAIHSRNPDLILIAGDLVESGGEQRDWDEFWLHNTNQENNLSLASSIPILAAPGNHEYSGGPFLDRYNQPASERAINRYLTYFEAPVNNSPNEEQEGRYYCINYGSVTFIVLDVCNNGNNTSGEDTNFFLLGESDAQGGNAPDFSPGSRQYTWLEQQLSENQNTSFFTFVVFHHSPYSVGPHGLPPGSESQSDRQSGVPIQMLTPLFMEYGVDAVFCGHDEMWERSTVSGFEMKSEGIKVKHTIHFFDVGIGGDGLREPMVGLDNLYQEFLVHNDVSELWQEGILLDGGKHYGHMEVDIVNSNDSSWQAVFSPVYVLPTWNSESQNYIGYERKIYDDQLHIYRTYSNGTIWDSQLIGNTDVYSSTTTAANRRATPVTFSEAGTIQSISIYHNGGNGSMLLGVYSDESGSPGSRLGVSSTASANSSSGWQTVDLSSPVSISAGQTVWLAWVFESNPGIRYTAGTPARANSPDTWSGGMPTSFGSSTMANYIYSIYCTYTPGVPTGGTWGNAKVFGTTTTIANRRAVPITASEPGSIESISIYHNGGNGSMLLGVYSDASGSPGSRLGLSSTATVNSSSGWQTVNLNSPVSISAGQTVWLAWVFESNPGIRYAMGTPARANSSDTWSGGMPGSFGSSTLANYIYSIYCNYSTSPDGDPCSTIIPIEGCGPENSQTFVSEGSGSWYSDSENPCGQPSYGQEQIYSFMAPVTGTYNLMVTETSGDYVDYLWKTGSCSSAGWECLNDISEPGFWASREWEEGTTYYILLDDENTEPSTHTFYIDCETPSTYPLGNTEVFGISTTVANRRAVPVTASEAGSIESISIYHNGGNGSMLLGVYSDATGSPSSRLGLSSTATVNSSSGWQTIDLNSPVSISAGQTVWLAWVFESNPGIRYTSGTPARANSPDTWSGGMPTSFGSSTLANYIYSIYCTYTPGVPTGGTWGNTEVFGTTTTVANRRAIPVTAGEAGSLETISIYHNGGSGSMLLGVYSDASGAPASRLGLSSTTSVSGSEGWQTINLTSPVSVSAGQTVWLAWVFESNPGIRYTTGTPGRANSPETWSSGMPTSFGTSTIANYIYSIYCTYSIGGTKAAGVLQGIESDPQDTDENHFMVYPNPTTGRVTVCWSQAYEEGLIMTLVNSIGETVEVLNIEPNWSKFELDLGEYRAGMYFIMIGNPEEEKMIHRGKVIKSR